MKKVLCLLCILILLVSAAGCNGMDEFTAALNKAQFSDQTPEALRENIVQQIQANSELTMPSLVTPLNAESSNIAWFGLDDITVSIQTNTEGKIVYLAFSGTASGMFEDCLPVFLTAFDENLDPEKCAMAVKTLFEQAKLDPGVGVIQPLEHITVCCTYSADNIYTLEIGDNEAIREA